MQTTTNYGLKIYEGTDLFNPLTVENVNTSDLDTIVKGVSNAAVGTATELLTGTVHALTRSDTARDVFRFTATANFEAGETFEVDGVQVTAKTPDGQNLSTGAYVINSSVLCILDGTLLTVIVNPAKALDADKLDGHDSTYFATAGDLSVLDNQVGAISSKVGTGVLDVGNDCVDGINTLNTHLNDLDTVDRDVIASGLTIERYGHYRKLTLENYSGNAQGELTTLAASDRPHQVTKGMGIMVSGTTTFSAYFNVNENNGLVTGRYFSGTTDASVGNKPVYGSIEWLVD